MSFIKNIIDSDARQYHKYEKLQSKILELESKYQVMSDDDLKNQTNILKGRLINETTNDILADAFAVVREAGYRVLNQKAYPCQIIGGIVLANGDIAEMKTGEGKTLTSIMPVYLMALEGKGVHVITVNEYLAKRDASWMGQIYNFLGLSVGLNLKDLSHDQKVACYKCDITYTTNSELGFDYLRDNMYLTLDNRVTRGLHYALIDEVDSVLIDEARTPLIISGFGESKGTLYTQTDMFCKMLKSTDYEISYQDNTCGLTESGIRKAEQYFKVEHLYLENNLELNHYLSNALRANFIMRDNVEYIVADNEIVLIDSFTGRKMEGREFSNGLHQALQAKENVPIKLESKNLGTITYQNFFRLYDSLAGMTGTAKTEESEFVNVYNMRVYEIPTNKPMIREDLKDLVYSTKSEKYNAIIEKIIEYYQIGRPVLVGTESIGASVSLSNMLNKHGIKHSVLNAKEHEYEATIIAQAGQKGSITIATNMAGRGTDIVLGDGVKELGGLVVLGSERFEAKRIDNQLRGRSARQGDPGLSQFYVSFEDDLVVKFASDAQKEMIKNTKISIDKARKLIDDLQLRAEGLHADYRKQVLEYDDVLMEQRRLVYKNRDEVLLDGNIAKVFNLLLMDYAYYVDAMNKELKINELKVLGLDVVVINDLVTLNSTKLYDALSNIYSERVNDIENIADIEKEIYIRVLDYYWNDHVDNMDRLKNGITFRSLAQVKPIDAYRQEAHKLFEDMMKQITFITINNLFKIQKAE